MLYFELLPTGTTVTAAVYAAQLESVKKTLLEKENTVLFFSLQDPDQNQILMERRRRGAVRMHRTCVWEADYDMKKIVSCVSF